MKKLSKYLVYLKSKYNKKYIFILTLLVVLVLLIFFIYSKLKGPQILSGSMTLNGFWDAVNRDEISYIVLSNHSPLIVIYFKSLHNGNPTLTDEYSSYEDDVRTETIINPGNKEFFLELTAKNVDVKIQQDFFGSPLSSLLVVVSFILILSFVISHFLRMSSMRTKTLNTEVTMKKNVLLFSEVAGMSEEKEELMFAIESLKNAKKLSSLGVRPLKGILLEGPPGVGKTLLAKAVAGEAGVNFIAYSGSDFVEMFVGVGASRVRKMYNEAVKNKPCVVFIDEIDALGSKREHSSSGGLQESNQTLVALLERLDGVNSENGILFMGATNRVGALDPALLRPGRFDKVIHIGPPKTKADREAIVAIHMRNKFFEEGITAEKVAKLCFSLTGAEIEAVLNDAIIESIKAGNEGVISLEHIDKAVMKMYVRGIAKGKHSKEEMHRIAVHEVGHALMNQHLGRKVVKVSIQPYSSGIGGVTVIDHETAGSPNVRSKDELIDDLKVLYAGMVAEKVIFENTSSGSSNDLEKATVLVKEIVGSYGMTEGMLLSLSGLNRENPLLISSEAFMGRMEKLAEDVYKSVENYLGSSDVKDKINNLALILMDKEVVYDFN